MLDLREAAAWGTGDAALEAATEFRRLIGQVIRGLIWVGGLEPVPIGLGPRSAQRLDDESRAFQLAEAFSVIRDGLGDLSALFRNHRPVRGDDEAANLVAEAAADIQGRSESLEGLVARLPAVEARRGIEALAREPLSDLIELVRLHAPIRKVFVAIHGIGDQFQNETVQTVAYRVCHYVGQPAAFPLGRFHGPAGTVTKAFVPEVDRDPALPCGFAEIYWADVPRGPASDKHVLEEPRKWARAIVERLRLKAPKEYLGRRRGKVVGKDEPAVEDIRHDDQIVQIIDELIQGVTVADRVASIAEKAGLFKFDLKGLLNDYLNDVQVVTEFEPYRRQLLAIFDDALTKIHKYLPDSEIYLVAHSEGTVVTLLGLLAGLGAKAPWTTRIRGLMTIGSPLNKHVRLWPELFREYHAPPGAVPDGRRIPWKNYYDKGDPIGYNLRPTRKWLAQSGWGRFFDFEAPNEQALPPPAPGVAGSPSDIPRQPFDAHFFDPGPEAKAKVHRKPAGETDDIGFTRSFFPGAAHNDYWRDPGVFGHFFERVVDPDYAVLKPDPTLAPEEGKPYYSVPRTDPFAWIVSYTLPYLLAAALLFLACYVLYKPIRGMLDPIGARFESAGATAWNVACLCGLIGGMSLLARVPRLSSKLRWRLWAIVFALPTFAYFGLPAPIRTSVESLLGRPDQPIAPAWFHNLGPWAYAGLAAGLIALLLAFRFLKPLRPLVLTITPILLLVFGLQIFHELEVAKLVVPNPWLAANWRSLGVVAIALLLGVMAWNVSRRYPEAGTKPLVHTGMLLILLMISSEILAHPDETKPRDLDPARAGLIAAGRSKVPGEARLEIAEMVEDDSKRAFLGIAADYERRAETLTDPARALDEGVAADRVRLLEAVYAERPIWPVFLGGAAFLYIWWLAIVAFDLTFVWHLYIRNEAAQRYVEQRFRASSDAPGGASGSDERGT